MSSGPQNRDERQRRSFDPTPYVERDTPAWARSLFGHWLVQLLIGLALLVTGLRVLFIDKDLGLAWVPTALGVAILVSARGRFKETGTALSPNGAIAGRRRWLRYEEMGQPRRWMRQPIFWGLAYIGASVIVQTVDAIYWMTRGRGWFDSAAGEQVPVLVVLGVVLAVVGLSRVPRR